MTDLKNNGNLYFKSYSKKISTKNNEAFENDSKIESDKLGKDKISAENLAVEKTRELYKQVLSNPYENVVIFSGAGTSISSGGKSMNTLWNEAEAKLTTTTFKRIYELVGLKYPAEDKEKDLEKFLSQTKMAKEVLKAEIVSEIQDAEEIIKELIRSACNLNISNRTHLEFLNKLTARKMKYSRVKIFTLNYDTLFEKSASLGKFSVIDGFSYSLPRFFDPTFFDLDLITRDTFKAGKSTQYVQKVFHLYKPHGSINWQKNDSDGRIYQVDETENPLMVFPNADKFEQSYEQPYFEMTSRLQRNLRVENTLLICIGFSFNDKHFRNVITEAAISNQSLNIVIVLPSFEDKEAIQTLLELSETQNNITFINEKFEDFVKNYPFPEEYGYEYDNPTTKN